MSADDFWNRPLEEPWRAIRLVKDRHGVEWEVGAQRRDPLKIRERVNAAVMHWIEQARSIPGFEKSGMPPIPTPQVRFDLKQGAIAGMAVSIRQPPRPVEQWIRINPELMHRYPVRMIQQTIPHEVAHLVVDWYMPGNRQPHHGPAWMAVMVYFGRPPAAYHHMEGRPVEKPAMSRAQRRLCLCSQ